MSDLQTYLASKYLQGAKADAILARSEAADGKRRKKKRKVAEDYAHPSGSRSSLIIDDGGDDDWRRNKEEEEEQAMIVESRQNAGFKPIVNKPEPEEAPLPDEAPVVVGAITEDAAPPPKPKKAKGGLQMAADVAKDAAAAKAAQAAQREREKKQLEDARRAQGLEEGEDDTVVRGPDGRPIDTKAAKAEEARRKRAEMEKEMTRMEWGKGLVQREDKERKREEEAAIAAKPMARFADDVDLNAQQKDIERWNDPAARFLTKKEPAAKRRGPVRPLYKGPPPPPNRFGILPGYRWDGVDRSNGFERRLSQAINDRKTRGEHAAAWSMEDM